MNDPQKKYRLGMVSKNILLECLNQFHSANLTLSSDVDQDTEIIGLHERQTPNLSMHHLLEHINQDIKRRESKDKDSTVNKTEYPSKINPTGKPWRE